jgi:hypothetical protein
METGEGNSDKMVTMYTTRFNIENLCTSILPAVDVLHTILMRATVCSVLTGIGLCI